MGTGTTLKVSPTPPVQKLPDILEEKVSNIVEICEVSREEAVRVLDACHMDETMAIDRFLNGNEVSTWSQVSKKKKPAASRSTSNARGANNNYPRNNDRDRDRRDRSQYQSDHGNRRGYRQHGYSHKSRDNSSNSKKRLPPQKSQPNEVLPPPQTEAIENWGSTTQSTEAWGSETPAPDNGDTWNDTYRTNTEVWADNPTTEPSDPAVDKSWNNSAQSASATPNAWGIQEPSPDVHEAKAESQKPDHDSTTMETSHTTEPSLKPPVVSTFNKVKRNFNYAAAAAAGTSHEKPAPIPASQPSPTELSSSVVAETTTTTIPSENDPTQTPVDTIPSTEPTETKKKRNRNTRKSRSRSESERQSHQLNGERQSESSPMQEISELEKLEAHSSPIVDDSHPEPEAPQPSAWSSPPKISEAKADKPLSDTTAATVIAPANTAAVVGDDQSTGDTLSLQFGSFGLGGLDAAVWSAEKKPQEPVVTPILPVEPKPVIPEAPIPSATTETSEVTEPVTAKVAQTPVPIQVAEPTVSTAVERPSTITSSQDVRQQTSSVSSAQLPSASVGVSGSGVVPLLPVAPGGNFAPNYGGTAYLMPTQHGYSPALGSYENSGDLGSSRAPNLVPPGSLPLYEPALPGMATGNAKYTGIPGLGDMSGVPGIQSGVSKEPLHGGGQEMDKANSMGTTTGLPAGMDPLAAPYMIPGYPSMQYIHPFYTGPYPPPPGMAPPGPSPFPYPPGGQVSSQGGRGGFGFEDGSIAIGSNSRSGSGVGESMYTPGYLNTTMPHSSSQKPPSDGSYKQVRGNPGNGISGMGMAGGVVHGMTYDYSGVPGGSNSIGNNGPGPRNWNNHQPNGSRGDAGGGPGVNNQSIGGGNQNSSVYAGSTGGAPGAYWAQQGGYYP